MEESDKAYQALSLFEDVLASEEEWQEIPEIVRLAFKTAHSMFKCNYEVNRRLLEECEKKVDREDAKNALKFKANFIDVEHSMDKVTEALDNKVSIEDLEVLLGEYVLKKEMSKMPAKTSFDDLEDRVTKLEEFAMNLDTTDPQQYAKHFATIDEVEAIKKILEENVKLEELKDFADNIITKDQLEEVLQSKVYPDISVRLKELQESTKQQFEVFIEELDQRVNLNDMVSIRKDIERIAKEKSVGSGTLGEIREEIQNLKGQLTEVETNVGDISGFKEDLSQVTNLNIEMQSSLDKIEKELAHLQRSSKREELELQLNSKMSSIESRVKKLEGSDKRTQEVLEILSEAKLKQKDDRDRPDSGSATGRSESLATGKALAEQIGEIKAYVDKKIKKTEVLMVKREEQEILEDKLEQFETNTNQIFDSLREATKELAKKVKYSHKELQESIQTKFNSIKNANNTNFDHVNSDIARAETRKGRDDGRSVSKEKLRNLDNLILKVTSLVDKRQIDEAERNQLSTKVKQLEERLEEKADKVKICKLIDRKAEIQDINKALVEIHEELDKQSTAMATKRVHGNGSKSEIDYSSSHLLYNKHALWLWRTNTTLEDSVVWDSENFNSDSKNIVLDKQKTGIILVTGGLFELSFGFFGSSKPHVELLLNDEPILSSKSVKQKEKYGGPFELMHTSGNVTGLTCVEYLILPPRGKITFQINGGNTMEGFCLIKKV